MASNDLVEPAHRILFPVHYPQGRCIQLLKAKLNVLNIFFCKIINAFNFLNSIEKSLNINQL